MSTWLGDPTRDHYTVAWRAAYAIRVCSGADLSAWLTRRGFTQVANMLLLERLLRKTAAVAPEVLNEYVGRYVWDARPEAPIEIERFGDSLVSKARDMRDVLLASSATEFFTRHHYGRGRFERDATGRVARLVYTEGPHEVVAQRVLTKDDSSARCRYD